MKKRLTKMVLGAAVLFAVAVVSYSAGAAKAKQSLQAPAGELKWEAMGPMQIAKLWGDRDKGPEYGMLLKFPGGADSGMHAHTGDYHAVSIQGTWVHTVEGDTAPAKELPPGSYVFQPGKQMHDDQCKGKVDCIIFVHQHAKGDFIPSKKPVDKAAAPAAAPAAPAAAPAAPAKK